MSPSERVAFLEDVFTHNIHCVAAVVKTGWQELGGGKVCLTSTFCPRWVEEVHHNSQQHRFVIVELPVSVIPP